jgi:hypothetical protein
VGGWLIVAPGHDVVRGDGRAGRADDDGDLFRVMPGTVFEKHGECQHRENCIPVEFSICGRLVSPSGDDGWAAISKCSTRFQDRSGNNSGMILRSNFFRGIRPVHDMPENADRRSAFRLDSNRNPGWPRTFSDLTAALYRSYRSP